MLSFLALVTGSASVVSLLAVVGFAPENTPLDSKTTGVTFEALLDQARSLKESRPDILTSAKCVQRGVPLIGYPEYEEDMQRSFLRFDKDSSGDLDTSEVEAWNAALEKSGRSAASDKCIGSLGAERRLETKQAVIDDLPSFCLDFDKIPYCTTKNLETDADGEGCSPSGREYSDSCVCCVMTCPTDTSEKSGYDWRSDSCKCSADRFGDGYLGYYMPQPFKPHNRICVMNDKGVAWGRRWPMVPADDLADVWMCSTELEGLYNGGWADDKGRRLEHESQGRRLISGIGSYYFQAGGLAAGQRRRGSCYSTTTNNCDDEVYGISNVFRCKWSEIPPSTHTCFTNPKNKECCSTCMFMGTRTRGDVLEVSLVAWESDPGGENDDGPTLKGTATLGDDLPFSAAKSYKAETPVGYEIYPPTQERGPLREGWVEDSVANEITFSSEWIANGKDDDDDDGGGDGLKNENYKTIWYFFPSQSEQKFADVGADFGNWVG